MDKLYIVTGSSGQYDSYYEWNVCLAKTEARAKQIVEKLEHLILYNNSFALKVKEFKTEYEKTNLAPKRDNYNPIPEYQYLRSKDLTIQNWITNNYFPPENLQEAIFLKENRTSKSSYYLDNHAGSSYEEISIL